ATRGPAGPDDVRALREQVEALAKRMEALPKEPADTAGITAQLRQFADRIGAVERRAGELAQARPGADGELKAGLERQATESKAALDRFADEARAAREKLAADSAQLRKDMVALQSRTAALAQDVEKGVAGNNAAPLVVAVGQLRRTVLEGTAYRPALDAVAALAKDRAEMTPALDALRARSEAGIATSGQLRARFDKMAVAVLRAGAAPGPAADFWDRVWSRVQSLATVRRTGDVAGETASAQIARAEAALARGELAEAVKQLTGLAGPAKEAAAGWLADAKARIEADAALARLDQAALGLLRAPEPKARP
ncbi:MAG: COG4223 family protein, partial [Alphaproteobacteria bacterium]